MEFSVLNVVCLETKLGTKNYGRQSHLKLKIWPDIVQFWKNASTSRLDRD